MVKPDSRIEYRLRRLMRVRNLKLSAGYAAFEDLSDLSHQLLNVGLNHLWRFLGDRMIRREQLRIVENLLAFKGNELLKPSVQTLNGKIIFLGKLSIDSRF